MTRNELRFLIRSDLTRYGLGDGFRAFVRVFSSTPGFKYTLALRLTRFLRERRGPLARLLFVPVKLILLRYGVRYGIQIPDKTAIGSGFYIGHFTGIVVNARATIGKNCNISHGVTIGQTTRGCPVIGDNVYIGPGAKVIGAVRVGDNVAIGANCVVTKDVPDNAVVVGVPGKVISFAGATGYVEHTNYA